MSISKEQTSPKKTKRTGSETRLRPGIVGFRVTEAERLELEDAANRAGLTLGSYIRACALAAPKTRAVRRPPVEKTLLAQLLGQIGKAGGNIHQIVKHMNFGEGVDRLELRSALAAFEGAAEAVMQALGKRTP